MTLTISITEKFQEHERSLKYARQKKYISLDKMQKIRRCYRLYILSLFLNQYY